MENSSVIERIDVPNHIREQANNFAKWVISTIEESSVQDQLYDIFDEYWIEAKEDPSMDGMKLVIQLYGTLLGVCLLNVHRGFLSFCSANPDQLQLGKIVLLSRSEIIKSFHQCGSCFLKAAFVQSDFKASSKTTMEDFTALVELIQDPAWPTLPLADEFMLHYPKCPEVDTRFLDDMLFVLYAQLIEKMSPAVYRDPTFVAMVMAIIEVMSERPEFGLDFVQMLLGMMAKFEQSLPICMYEIHTEICETGKSPLSFFDKLKTIKATHNFKAIGVNAG